MPEFVRQDGVSVMNSTHLYRLTALVCPIVSSFTSDVNGKMINSWSSRS